MTYGTAEKVKRMRASTGLSQSQFAALFDIPTRTLQKWECGQSEPKAYVLQMMQKILERQHPVHPSSNDIDK